MTAISASDAGERFASMGDEMRFALVSAQTNGQFTLIEDTVKPGFNAALHLHRRHSETFHILEGVVSFTIDRQRVRATPGMTLHITPNTPHSAQADAPARMLTLVTPAGIEDALRAFQAASPAESAALANDPSRMAQFDIIDLATPPIPTLLQFYDLLLREESATLLALFVGEAHIDTPLAGAVRGNDAFRQFVQNQARWLRERAAQSRFVEVIITPARIVVELELVVQQGGQTVRLPVAVVADREGELIAAVRIYHSTWPLNGTHLLRAPMLQRPATELAEPALIAAYFAGIREPNSAFVQSLFAADGFVREPSGGAFQHNGAEGRAAFYGMALGRGGVELRHCTATDDGNCFAVEYICDAWAHVALPPQAGMAVYARANATQLRAVRIYDDVTPPVSE